MTRELFLAEREIGSPTGKSLIAVPSVLILLAALFFLAVVATHVVPGGEYGVSGNAATVPGSYAAVESKPVSFMDAGAALGTGFIHAAPTVLPILLIGGALGVLHATGSLHALITRLVEEVGVSKYLVLTFVMVLFGTAAAVGVITSEVVVFFPVGLMVAAALGLDKVTGLLIILLPNAIGYAASFLNPSSLAVAQDIAGLPPFSGMGYRAALFVLLLVLTIGFVLLHVYRTSTDRGRRSVEPAKAAVGNTIYPASEIGNRHKLVLAGFAGLLVLFALGSSAYHWETTVLAGCFITFAIMAGRIFRMRPRQLLNDFLTGMRPMLVVGLVIILARSVTVVLQEGRILDALVFGLYNLGEPLTPHGGVVTVLLGSAVVNFLVPSGTGQAALTMPLITPLADLWGFSRQLGVLSFQLGDGVTNILHPTSPVLMAGLAVANIGFGRWLRLILPYAALILAVAILGAIAGVWLGYQ